MNTKQLAKIIARNLRRNQTSTEKVFWEAVRDRRFYGKKFRRQHSVFYEYHGQEKFFIADFYCSELNLIAEIDGGIHEQQQDYDTIRNQIMQTQKNLRITRLTNQEVQSNFNDFLRNLKKLI